MTRLMDVVEERPDVELPTYVDADGATHPELVTRLRRVDAIGFQLRDRIVAGELPDTAWWDLAARCLPGVPRERVDALEYDVCQAIIVLASSKADELLKLRTPEGDGGTEGNGSPGRAPATSSAPATTATP